jgi:hypothetical protein
MANRIATEHPSAKPGESAELDDPPSPVSAVVTVPGRSDAQGTSVGQGPHAPIRIA